jgi:NADPH-dependent 2,4-dienoyl-CoA reductase/sulfur reductase-like enzyme
MRVEHWTNAIEQGVYAARRLLGRHEPSGFRSVPYFWSDQCGLKIQSVGSTLGFDEVRVLDEDDDRLLLAYGSKGVLVCVAGLNAGAAVMRFRAQVMDGVLMGTLVPLVRT